MYKNNAKKAFNQQLIINSQYKISEKPAYYQQQFINSMYKISAKTTYNQQLKKINIIRQHITKKYKN